MAHSEQTASSFEERLANFSFSGKRSEAMWRVVNGLPALEVDEKKESQAALEEACIPNRDPSRTVFQTAKLVENILSFLPPRNIFEVLRVSRSFYNVLKSPSIQERKFLRCKNKPQKFWKRGDHASDDEDSDGERDDERDSKPAVELSPFLDRPKLKRDCFGQFRMGDDPSYLDRSYIRLGIGRGDFLDCLRAESSIWQTYFYDPPCGQAEAVFSMSNYWNKVTAEHTVAMTAGDGLRWGELMDKLHVLLTGGCPVHTPEAMEIAITHYGWKLGSDMLPNIIRWFKCRLSAGFREPDNKDWEAEGEAP